MSWTIFKNTVIRKMQRSPKTSDDTAKIIADAYEKAVKAVSSGDKIGSNRVIRGNKPLMQKKLTSLFNNQSKQSIPLPLHQLMIPAFISYWTGAQLSTVKIPPTPAPGSVANTSVITNPVINPGTPITVPGIPIGKSQTTEQFVNNIVKVAKAHLKTISGTTNTISLYSPGPPPTGTVPGPGVVSWTGYRVVD